MIEALAKIIATFAGPASQTRCFAHILNLVVKIILRRFDSRIRTSKKKATKPKGTDGWDDAMDEDVDEGAADAEALLAALKEELEEFEMDVNQGDEEVDDERGLDELEASMEDDVEEVDAGTAPIRNILFKVRLLFQISHPVDSGLALYSGPDTDHLPNVFPSPQLRKIAFSVKNSPTILLPRWRKILEELINAQDPDLPADEKLTDRMIPRDVSTRWNSTYEMVSFAYKYRAAIDKLTAEREMKLHDYELSSEEWEIVQQLSESLEVRTTLSLKVHFLRPCIGCCHRYSRTRHYSSPGTTLRYPPSFLLWTRSTATLLRVQSMKITPLPCELHSLLGRSFSINTTPSAIFLRCTELLLVSYSFVSSATRDSKRSFSSLASSTKAGVLREGKVAQRLD
jgi:hypothetical protein